MNIILCGLKSCGKSTIGKLLAKRLNLPHYETDLMIEKAFEKKKGHKASCRDIFKIHGEMFFRDMENQQIALLKTTTGGIISLGGGTLENKENLKAILRMGLLVYLKANPQTFWERLNLQNLPVYLTSADPQSEFMQNAEERMSVFHTYAHHSITVENLSADCVVNQIIGLINYGK